MTTPAWTVRPQRTALLVIDMQNDFVLPGAPMEVPAARETIPPQQRMLSVCRELGISVIYTQHVLYDGFDVSPLETAYNPLLKRVGMRAGTPGVDIVDALAPRDGEVVMPKHRYDAFHNTPLETLLSTVAGPGPAGADAPGTATGTVDTVAIIGTVTEVCCESTARSAFMRDYKVAFLSDATGSLAPDAQRATERSIGTFFGRVLTVDEFSAEARAAR
ncbi:cysteine hydrolase [Spiractinospora alimapuensis]|uniref:isochorismatase family protein n=1 Tax=Spiractinospora alimapuensis TaxID=2820884 RepID=UPI001F26A435|nr:isochorismatase family cysteine hydrolase [Spiractinospora alimapuensis]QVQ51791.1 cysteine hydrolase [Spiractinospora alimapuensis]